MTSGSGANIENPTGPARRNMISAAGLAVLSLLAWALLVIWLRPTFVGDEWHHVPAIQGIAQGNWDAANELPMPPGYHLLLALPAWLVGHSLLAIRLSHFVCSLVVLLAFHLAARTCLPRYGPADLLRCAWHPLLLPLWIFVYTDLLALAGVLFGLYFQRRRQHFLAGVVLALACLVRQSTIIWAALVAAWAAAELWQQLRPPHRLADLLRNALPRLWPYLLPIIPVAWFVLLVGPVRSTESHNDLCFNPAQFYLLPLVAALLWAPRWLADFGQAWTTRFGPALLHARVSLLLVAIVGVLMLAFSNPHTWNQDWNYLRNWPLLGMAHYRLWRGPLAALMVLFIATETWSTWRQPLRRTLASVWGCAVLFLSLHFLADPRYYIIPLLLVELLRARNPTTTRRLTVWYLALSLMVATFILARPGGLIGIW